MEVDNGPRGENYGSMNHPAEVEIGYREGRREVSWF
jgi:hypothetical protein